MSGDAASFARALGFSQALFQSIHHIDELRLARYRLFGEGLALLFGFVQESLTNVFRHAETQRAKVRCLYVLPTMELQTGSFGIGIIGIKQRVEELGGQLVFRNTTPGRTVEVTIPAKSARGQSVVGRLS